MKFDKECREIAFGAMIWFVIFCWIAVFGIAMLGKPELIKPPALELDKQEPNVKTEFLMQSCAEANPYKSLEQCSKQVSEIHMILTKEKL